MAVQRKRKHADSVSDSKFLHSGALHSDVHGDSAFREGNDVGLGHLKELKIGQIILKEGLTSHKTTKDHFSIIYLYSLSDWQFN